ncbi:WbqC family protein [Pseudarcicella hirudinis]|nr:WbqC family protein [Pseudarcicella hirudinis]
MNQSKICAVMQPTYLPWLGYFDMIDKVDVFVFLDNVQLMQRSWQTRNRIKNIKGEEIILSIPVKKTARFDEITILNAEPNNESKWSVDHLRKIEDAYRKSTYFSTVNPLIKEFYSQTFTSLADFHCKFISQICNWIGIDTPLIRASDLGSFPEIKDVKTVKIIRAINCNSYLSARGSAEYIEANTPGGEFTKHNIPLYYHNYEHPQYPQINGAFLPFMGIIDLLYNVGFEQSLSIIKTGRRNDIYYSEFLRPV